MGVLVAKPVSVSGATLIKNLRKDSAVLDADYDRVLDLIEPQQVLVEEGATPETHAPHPFPFPASPPDFFYTSTGQQWSVKRVGAQGGGIPGGGSGAWDTTFGAGVTIAILDTGVNPVHPDTAPNLVGNITEIIPAQFPSPCDDGSPIDQHGHGTWTASLAAGATGPGTGLVIGVAPQASILNVKVLQRVPDLTLPVPPFDQCRLGGGSGLFSWVLQGIIDANANGADVISMSLGGFVPRNAQGGAGAAVWSAFNRVTNFVTNNGSLIVASAGNSALDLDNLGSFAHLPSDSPNVIAVTATTNPSLPAPGCPPGIDCLAFYSNFGSSLHGLAAPGGDFPAGGSPGPTGFVRGACSAGIPGTVPGLPGPGTSFGCFSFAGAAQHAWYVQAIGTSASAPHVAGVAALVKSVNPGLSPAQIRTILQQTAQDIGKVGYDQFFNFGLVDATAAVAAAP
jgi:subtilisin family serine protease